MDPVYLRRVCAHAIEKKAFLGSVIGGGIRMLGPMLFTHGVQSKVLPRIAASNSLIGRGAARLNDTLNTPGIKGTLANVGMHAALSPVVDPMVHRAANIFDGQSQ
jgi:hypothetical protein